jgi:parvulin-like peptidyl-prolyl isomerase
MKPLFLLLSSLSLASLSSVVSAAVLDRVVAKVNGEIITLSEFEERQIAALQAENVTADRVEAFLEQKSGQILQQAIDDILLAQKAEDLGIRIKPEALDQIVEDIKKENKLTTDEAFQAELAREGLTLEGLRRNITRSIAKRRVISREIEGKIVVTEDEIRPEYERRRDDFRRPETVKLQEIVLSVEVGEKKAKEAATGLVARARAGEDFGALARQHSTAATAAAGGDLGAVALAELHPELRRAIANLTPGQITDPIVLAGSVRLLKLGERTPARVVPYDEAREEIARRLRQDRLAREYETYVATLRKDAVIDLRVREVPKTLTVPAATEPTLRREAPTTPEPTLEWMSPGQ